MTCRTLRHLGAMILGALLALPLAALSQQPAQSPPPVKAFDMPARDGSDAPKSGGEKDAQKPRPPQLAPAPVQGSTAVPGWNKPPEWGSISETRQYASLPGIDTNRLIQRQGREWRAFRNGPLTFYGGWLIGIVFFAIMLFYFVKGSIKLKHAPTGRLIERFNAVERAAHWTMAISFVFLALTGAIMLWGKYIILPWLGYSGFSWLTIVGKNLHNFVGPLFIFALLVSFLIFVRDNVITRVDWAWMSHMGGMFSGKEVPSGRFNGLEKVWFWGGLTLLGLVMAATGLILDFPNWDQSRQIMQLANVVHDISAVLFISAALGHAYMGTIGMEGAYRAMRDGYVDEEWAREHHSLWYDEVRQGKRPEKIVTGRAMPAAGDD
ncbi:MAG TPA: formate dehydrogenase subunit gamma [Usitatibacter sp.]|jgi:formate dehydrogenase subunit gamma|nr:formate dehydrogenase subunit gamma [Usitatibacter sp.]